MRPCSLHHVAVKHGFYKIVNVLLDTMSVDMNVVNKDGLTAGDLARAAALSPLTYLWVNLYLVPSFYIFSHLIPFR
jgi:hypothetical protein